VIDISVSYQLHTPVVRGRGEHLFYLTTHDYEAVRRFIRGRRQK